jgi:hypothetical protein
VRRRAPIGQEVGVDLLLAASDAFAELADEMAAEYARRYDEGAQPDVLEWTRRVAEVAGWWCGRLEAEADHAAGFVSGGGRSVSAEEGSEASSARHGHGANTGCPRRRRHRPR